MRKRLTVRLLTLLGRINGALPPLHASLRWLDLTLLGFIGFLVFELVYPASWSVLRTWTPPAFWPVWVLTTSLVLALVLVFWGLVDPLRTSPGQIKRLKRHPPLWAALLISWVFITARRHCLPVSVAGHPDATAIPAWIPLCIIGTLSAIIAVKSRGTQRSTASPTPRAGRRLPLVWNDLKAWARTERPHDLQHFDLVGIEHIATRMARLLTSRQSDEPAIAVLGAFGSGKSTLIGRVIELLRESREPDILSVRVSTWGLESADVSAHVLGRVVDELQNHVDALPFRSLPNSYRRFLGAEKIKFLERVLDPSVQQPLDERLRRLSELLLATDIRLVIFIEDADRAASTDFDPTQLERLLWHFHETRGITFVVAIDQGQLRSDLSKLFEREEPIPELRGAHFGHLLSLLRRHCRDDFPYLLPLGAKDNDLLKLNSLDDPLTFDLLEVLGDTPLDAARRLVGTPRLLKHVVRRAEGAWTRLHGEVDLDELIVLTILRVGAPDVFNFLRRTIRIARIEKSDFDPRPAQVQGEWKKQVETEEQFQLAQPLVDLLGIRQFSAFTSDEPQGVQASQAADHFDRIVAEDVEDAVLDQAVLRDMHSFVQATSKAMTDRLEAAASDESDPYLRCWRGFASTLPDDELWRASVELITAAIDDTPPRVRDFAQMACWAEVIKRPLGTVRSKGLEELILRALERSIPAAADLYYFWAASGKHPTMTRQDREHIRTAIHTRTLAYFDDPATLNAALEHVDGPDAKHWLSELLLPSDPDQPVSPHRSLTDWQPLGPALLAALLLQPTIMGPQLLRAVGTADGQFGKTRYSLDDAKVTALFGPLRAELLRAFASLESQADNPELAWAASRARMLLDSSD